MKNDRDEKMLIEAWKSLTTPLPCAPGVPAHVMKTVLMLEFPWMEEVIATIAGELRFREVIGLAFFHLRPLLLVGPPGCGKTAFARRIAELSGVALGNSARQDRATIVCWPERPAGGARRNPVLSCN